MKSLSSTLLHVPLAPYRMTKKRSLFFFKTLVFAITTYESYFKQVLAKLNYSLLLGASQELPLVKSQLEKPRIRIMFQNQFSIFFSFFSVDNCFTIENKGFRFVLS